MRTKIYLNNNSLIRFGDTNFSRENKLSCKEACVTFKNNAVQLDTGSQKVVCDIDDLGFEEDDFGYFYEIDL